jgi:phage terminase small subunit
VEKEKAVRVGKLNDKQKVFCLKYIKELNGTKAAIEAGYSQKTARKIASENLTKPDIVAEIQRLNKKRFEKLEGEGQKVITELAKIGFSDIRNYLAVDDGGTVTMKNLQKMHNTGAISSIKEKRVIREAKGDSEDIVLDDTLEVKLWDKNKALENLAKHYNLFKDQGDVNININNEQDLTKLTDKELLALKAIQEKINI